MLSFNRNVQFYAATNQRATTEDDDCGDRVQEGISAPWQTSLDIFETLSEPLSVLPRLGFFPFTRTPFFVEGLKIFGGDEWRIAQVLRKC